MALFTASDTPFHYWVSETPGGETNSKSLGKDLSREELKSLTTSQPTMPYHSLTVGKKLSDGTLWVGSEQGLMLLSPGSSCWRLFHSRRQLLDDHIHELKVLTKDEISIRTATGTCRLVHRMTTLDDKIQDVHRKLRSHHLREGFVGEIHLNKTGSLADGYTQHTNDNDGLWTSLYVAAEAFRYGATGDNEAKKNAWESLQSMMFLEKITGIPGFVARSILPGDGPNPKARYGGVWYRSANGEWWWKGDTSSDEMDGHYFAYAVYYDLAADAEQKKMIRDTVSRITDHIIQNGFYLIGPTGKPTTWGVWAPEKLNHDLNWILERGLNSLELLAYLKVVYHITGNKKYHEISIRLIKLHSYATNTIRQKIVFPVDEVNHSDDELAFLAYYPLLIYERNEELRKKYLASIERSWQIERPEQSPLFNYIYAAARQADVWKDPSKRPPITSISGIEYDREASEQWFRDVPVDLFDWHVNNKLRHDLGARFINRFGRECASKIAPIYERTMLRWNADPYQLEQGGSGNSRNDGAFILLPYWMGRYHRLLD